MDKSFVVDRLKRKKELDPDCIGFGVERHKYELCPPIAEKNLLRLEKKFKISLPEDYREFITNIGNGGAGPSYGLYSIEGALGGKDPTYQYRASKVGDEINKNFVRPDEVSGDNFLSENGTLILCQHGCANDDFLVLNDKEKGNVWQYIEWVGHLVPLLKNMPDLKIAYDLPESKKSQLEQEWVNSLLVATNEEKMTFSDWYCDWLEKPPHILPGTKKVKKKKRECFKLW